MKSSSYYYARKVKGVSLYVFHLCSSLGIFFVSLNLCIHSTIKTRIKKNADKLLIGLWKWNVSSLCMVVIFYNN